ncbi:MAG: hypothetical protein H8E15_04730 [Planctomycetes bacterium]|nr:hypothetical protein [Planctomycetota bacterium]
MKACPALYLPLLITSCFTGNAIAQEDGSHHLWTWRGRAEFNKISSIADQDGDGVRDLIFGHPVTGGGGSYFEPYVGIFSGRTGLTIREMVTPDGLKSFGKGVGDAGDVNGDGIDDFMVSAPGGDGFVFVFSGADQQIIHRFVSKFSGQHIGNRVGGVGDVDGDGLADIAFSGGGVFVFSGATARFLYRLPDGQFRRAGDLDMDGIDDIVVGYPKAAPSGVQTGEVVAYSGIDGSPLWQTFGPWADSSFASSIAMIGDVTGDGASDVIVGAHQLDYERGAICLLDGANGQIFERKFGHRKTDKFGVSVAGPGDMNGDGIPDYVVGAKQRRVDHDKMGGYVEFYSGQDHRLFLKLRGKKKHNFGLALTSPGDIDNDGLADILIGKFAEEMFAFSYNPYFLADAESISISGTRPIQFLLRFPYSEAGRDYRILASYSGTGPTLVNGFEIPLTLDEALLAGLNGQLPPGSVHFAGKLNGNAKAFAQWSASSFLAPWVGQSFQLAAVSCDTIGPVWIGRIASAPITLEILP